MAIEICKQSKIPLSESLSMKEYGLSPTATWLDFSNMIAQQDPNKKLNWEAEQVKDNEVYIVAFVDEKGWGQRWEVTPEQKIVKFINTNEYLSRKYGLSRKGGSTEFKVLVSFTSTKALLLDLTNFLLTFSNWPFVLSTKIS